MRFLQLGNLNVITHFEKHEFGLFPLANALFSACISPHNTEREQCKYAPASESLKCKVRECFIKTIKTLYVRRARLIVIDGGAQK